MSAFRKSGYTPGEGLLCPFCFRNSNFQQVFGQLGAIGRPLLLLTCYLLATQLIQAQTSWTGLLSTDWHTAGNWSAGVPDEADDVTISDVMNDDPTISTAAVAKSITVQSGAVLTIAAAGSLAIDGGGFLNHGNTENSGTLTIGAISGNGLFGIRNEGVFNNNSGGQISIDRSTGTGLFSSGTFTNNATINIGSTASVGAFGLDNTGTFNNNSGVINIDNCTFAGLRQNTTGSFSNLASIVIGANTSVGDYGLIAYNYFLNAGTIQIDRSTFAGLLPNQSTCNFQNQGAVTIGANASVGPYSIFNSNSGSVTNQACGQFRLYATYLQQPTCSFTNNGLLWVNTSAAHFNDNVLTNNGIIDYVQNTTIPNVVNNGIVVAPISGQCSISPALSLGAMAGFSIGTTWFSDANLTQPAGTYTPATNTLAFTDLAEGISTLYFTVTDNTNSCTRTISIQVNNNDVTPPTIVACVPSQTIPCNVHFAFPLPEATDNCGSVTVVQTSGPVSGSSLPVGATVLGFKATDASGNSATCSATITVNDATAPTVACKPATVNLSAAGTGSITTASVFQSGSDNCGTVNQVSVSTNTFTCSNLGSNTVTLTVNDGHGNSATCSAVVTVNDATAPTITCPANIVRSADAGQCSAVVNYSNPAYSDNCSGAGLDHISGGISGSAFPKGLTTVVWQVSDASNNTRRCTFTVTVNDTQLPNISCPANQTVGTVTGQCYGTTMYTVGYSDNCPEGGALIQSGIPSGGNFPKGQTTVVWRATDGAGLTRTCSFRVTVNDTEAPVITCPNGQSVNTAPNLCTANVTYATPTATDNCTTVTVLRIGGPASGSNFPLGATNVTWRAIDGAGRSSTCSFSVTVTDAQAPVITCPQSMAVTGGGSPCTATTGYATPTATDNCSVQSVFLLSGQPSGSSFPAGTTNIVWRAVDNGGNSATCSFTVTVGCGASPDPSEGGENVTAERDVVFSPLRGGREGLLLSPNPATTEVTIFIENLGETGGELTVLDAQGRTVWQRRFGPEALTGEQQPSVTLDVSGEKFAPGLYFVTLRSEGRAVTKRLVVARL